MDVIAMDRRPVGGYKEVMRYVRKGYAVLSIDYVDAHGKDVMVERSAMRSVKRAIKAHFGNKVSDVRFNARLGCKCGCSPMFYADMSNINDVAFYNARIVVD